MSKEKKKWEEEFRKKLNEELPEGIYDISAGNLVCFTGKQGKIDLEVGVIKELKKKGNE
tara:strand:+ start:573 stop:749 length:177 start_codon:yes stop_codon:yes gene_type:complete